MHDKSANCVGAGACALAISMFIGGTASAQLCDSGDVSTTCFLSHAYQPVDGELIEANDLVIQNGGSITNTSITSADHGVSISVVLSGDLTVEAGASIRVGSVAITASSLVVELGAEIQTSSLGFIQLRGPGAGAGGCNTGGSGAGHGGTGGVSDGSHEGGPVYDTAGMPSQFGSGGGNSGCSVPGTGGNGGGIVLLDIAGATTIDGIVAADGGVPVLFAGGGGSGGSITVMTNALSGAGMISARGGDSEFGAGGGGRIDVSNISSNAFIGTYSVEGGGGAVRFSENGRAGTILFDGATLDSFTLTHDLTLGADLLYEFGDLHVTNGAVLVFDSNTTITVPGTLTSLSGTGAVVNARSVTVDAGAAIAADGRGFHASGGPGAGNGGCNTGGGGAGHGGIGGDSTKVGGEGGPIYGASSCPTTLGSGGGRSLCSNIGVGGYGGGAITLNVAMAITVNGRLSADGGAAQVLASSAGGGGSGGSLYLIARTLAGTGEISASGGGVLSVSGGGGGGGLIDISGVLSNVFAGDLDVSGAPGGENIAQSAEDGRAGVILFDEATLQDFTVSSDLVLGNGAPYQFGTLRITNGAVLTFDSNTDAQTGAFINANNIVIEAGASLTASAMGFEHEKGPGKGGGGCNLGGGGGGHGGIGGDASAAAGGTTYGSPYRPLTLGSGAGSSGCSFLGLGGRGGGALHLNIAGALTVDGTLSADGENVRTQGGGGGAGGSIYVVASSIDGAGVISAAGGDGGSAVTQGGGGGGGRIDLSATSSFLFTGRVDVAGGTGAAKNGEHGRAGTIVYDEATLANFTVSRDLVLGAGMIYNFGNLVVTNGATLLLDTDTDDINAAAGGIAGNPFGSGATMNADNVTIDAGAAISSDGRGFANFRGPGKGGGDCNTGGAGAGHGGAGGPSGGLVAGGVAYGSATAPTQIGSGGGDSGCSFSGTGGYAGGYVRLNVSGVLDNNGRLSADGSDFAAAGGGGGSGGSIWVVAGSFTGTGVVSAAGGRGGTATRSGGGGGGGRIYVKFQSNSFAGTIVVDGGAGGTGGGPGVAGTGLVLPQLPAEDSDADGTPDGDDLCNLDPNKVAPDTCGCGNSDADTDLDGIADCIDQCPLDAGKFAPGVCGCGNPDDDDDGDLIIDCIDPDAGPFVGVCVAPPPACCLQDGGCEEVNVEECTLQGGTPRGAGSVCAGDNDGNGVDDACQPNEPCDGCGLVAHWVDTCPAGEDFVPSQALIGIDLDGDCQEDTSLILSGPVAIQHGAGDPVTHTIDAEIVSMNLTGGGVTLRAGANLGIRPSTGQIVEQPGDNTMADSIFNVFFEVSGDGLPGPVYNHDAFQLGSTIDCLPPNTTYVHEQSCIPLFDSRVPGQGMVVANLVSANHTTFATGACCLPDGSCQDVRVEECTLQGGTPRSAGSVCAGDNDGNGVDDACQANEPCDGCGLVAHWVDTCPAGEDFLRSQALVGIDLDGDCQEDTSLILSGPVAIQHGPGNPVTHTIDAEIVSMNLIGGGVTLRAGAILGLRPSTGQIVEQPGDNTMADSIFDVFFEVSGDGLPGPVYNHDAFQLGSTIDCLPPNTTYVHEQSCIPLFDSRVPGQGMVVANLVSANHMTFPTGRDCDLDTTCDEHICKRVKYRTEDGDCLIEVGEKVDFETTIDVVNDTDDSWTNTDVGDCFFSDVELTDFHTQQGTFQVFQAGNDKTCVRWQPGDLGPGESGTLVIDARTGLDRKGRQQYRICGNHSFNNGALLRFSDSHNQSFRTGPLVVSVLTPDAEGDCDGDGFSDQVELDAGSDPHDPNSIPIG